MPVLSYKGQSNSASITDMEKTTKLPPPTPDSPTEYKKKKKPPKFLDSIHQMQKNSLHKNGSLKLAKESTNFQVLNCSMEDGLLQAPSAYNQPNHAVQRQVQNDKNLPSDTKLATLGKIRTPSKKRKQMN